MNIIDIIGYLLVCFGVIYWIGVIHSTGNWRGERQERIHKRRPIEDMGMSPSGELYYYSDAQSMTPLDDLFEGKHAHEYPVPARPNPDIVPQTVHGNYPSKRSFTPPRQRLGSETYESEDGAIVISK